MNELINTLRAGLYSDLYLTFMKDKGMSSIYNLLFDFLPI